MRQVTSREEGRRVKRERERDVAVDARADRQAHESRTTQPSLPPSLPLPFLPVVSIRQEQQSHIIRPSLEGLKVRPKQHVVALPLLELKNGEVEEGGRSKRRREGKAGGRGGRGDEGKEGGVARGEEVGVNRLTNHLREGGRERGREGGKEGGVDSLMGRVGKGARGGGSKGKGEGMTNVYLQPFSIHASVNKDLLVKGRGHPDWEEGIERGGGGGGGGGAGGGRGGGGGGGGGHLLAVRTCRQHHVPPPPSPPCIPPWGLLSSILSSLILSAQPEGKRSVSNMVRPTR